MMMMIIIDSINGMQLVVGGHRFQKKFTSILKIKYPTCSSLWLTYAINLTCFSLKMNLLSFIFIINYHTRLLNAVCKFVEITRISICGADNSDTASHLRLIRYYISLICLLSEYWMIVINISHLHVDLYSSTQRRYSKICGYYCQLYRNKRSMFDFSMSAM